MSKPVVEVQVRAVAADERRLRGFPWQRGQGFRDVRRSEQQNTCIDLIGSTRNRELSFLTNFALPVAKQPASVMRLIWFTASSFSYVFVEPGVKQLLTYVTIIPENIRFILVHAQFTYLNHDPHGAEKNPIQIGV